MSAGKGDTPRPLSVSADQYAENWARTFGKKEPAQPPTLQTIASASPAASITEAMVTDTTAGTTERNDINETP